jgi:hypothetical protein
VSTETDKTGGFRKVGECLYRYSSNGVYYARIKAHGKEIRQSLGTTDRNLAKLKREQGQIDRSQGKLTLRELCDQWLETIQDSNPKTLEQKSYIAGRIKQHWPTGSLVQVAKIKPSDCDLWLARCAQKSRNGFSPSSRNAHVQILKEVFALALRDRIISDSLAAHLKYVKREKPIRLTPNGNSSKRSSPVFARRCLTRMHETAQTFWNFSAWRDSARLGHARLHALMSILRSDD